jgi:protein involved in polysaccharide export with SLBB domain
MAKSRYLVSVLLIGVLALAPLMAPAAIKPGDKLDVRVANAPDLSAEVTVDSDGTISLPVVGTITAAGYEPGELAGRLQTALRRYARLPHVDVHYLARTDAIFVSGATPGFLSYKPGLPLDAAVASVERQPGTDPHSVVVVRDGRVLGPYDLTRTDVPLTLQPGDRIILGRQPIAVAGEGALHSRGPVYLAAGQSLGDAVRALGGFDNAAFGSVDLIRAGSRTTYPSAAALDDVTAVDGDTLAAPTAPSVLVIGMVEHTGRYQLFHDASLLSGLYSAGGPNGWADLRAVQIRRTGEPNRYVDITQLVHGDDRFNPILRDGDVVFVPEGHKIDFRGFFQTLLLGRGLTR